MSIEILEPPTFLNQASAAPALITTKTDAKTGGSKEEDKKEKKEKKEEKTAPAKSKTQMKKLRRQQQKEAEEEEEEEEEGEEEEEEEEDEEEEEEEDEEEEEEEEEEEDDGMDKGSAHSVRKQMIRWEHYLTKQASICENLLHSKTVYEIDVHELRSYLLGSIDHPKETFQAFAHGLLAIIQVTQQQQRDLSSK